MPGDHSHTLFSPFRTPYNKGLRAFWLETNDGFLLQPKVGRLSLYAFLGSFLLFVVAFGVFLEILAALNAELVEYKFRMYLTFTLFAPVLSTVVAFFFRRMIRGFWGELRYFKNTQKIRIARKGRAVSLPKDLLLQVKSEKVEFSNGETQWIVILHFRHETEENSLKIYFWGFPEQAGGEELAQQLEQRLKNADS